jgi:hypothetical protein
VGQLTAGRVGENGDGSCCGSLLGELRAMMMCTRQCDVQVAGTYQPGSMVMPLISGSLTAARTPKQLGQTDLVSVWRAESRPVEQ